MISRLLKELGVPLDWVDGHDSSMIEKTMARSAGLFFVEDASEATDQEGRKIIAAQDFVSQYGVKGVFGIGRGVCGRPDAGARGFLPRQLSTSIRGAVHGSHDLVQDEDLVPRGGREGVRGAVTEPDIVPTDPYPSSAVDSVATGAT